MAGSAATAAASKFPVSGPSPPSTNSEEIGRPLSDQVSIATHQKNWLVLPSLSWVVVWMLRADIAAIFEASGVLNAFALAIVLRGAEALLVRIGRVRPEHHGQA